MSTRFSFFPITLAALLVLVADPATLNRSSACEEVTGRLVDYHVEGDVSVGQMIGSIEGSYEFTLGPGFDAGIPGFSIWFVTGTSFVVTEGGTLSFVDASAMDLDEQVYSNAADLATITGGTGIWKGASGHLILSGYWHTDSESGEFDYQGEVCLGPVSHEEDSWGKVKGRFRD
jgi:hypothetical protein